MKTSHLRENDPDVRQKLDYSFQDGGKGQLAKYDGRTVSITENGDVITTNRLPQSSPKIFRQTPEISIVNGDPGQNYVHRELVIKYGMYSIRRGIRDKSKRS